MWWWHGGGGWGGWLGMTLVMVAFWGVVIWGAVTLFRRSEPGGGGTRDAKDVLAERYAAGEIDEAEYRQRLEVLQGGLPRAGR